VLQLPWETLHHPELGFLGRDPAFALSRRPVPPPDGTPVPERGPLRVLLFTSLPEDLDPERGRLDVEAEQAAANATEPSYILASRHPDGFKGARSLSSSVYRVVVDIILRIIYDCSTPSFLPTEDR
jgi:hypothetical protein